MKNLGALISWENKKKDRQVADGCSEIKAFHLDSYANTGQDAS